MEPNKRISAEDAYYHPYFKQEPRACSPNDLPVPKEDLHGYSGTNDAKNPPNHQKELLELESFKREHENK